MRAITWPIVVFVLLLLSRKGLLPVLQSLAAAIQERGGTLDATVLKLQVGEAAMDTFDDRSTFFSRSPLEIEEDVARESSSLIGDLGPQLDFPISGSVASEWAQRNPGTRVMAQAVVQARTDLETACETAETFQDVRTRLVLFVQSLERARFPDASKLADLFGRRGFLREGVDQIQPGALADAQDDYLILHAAGVAYAQKAEWTKGKTLLEKIIGTEQAENYLPAGDTWLACAYNERIQALQKLDVDSPEVFTSIGELLDRGQHMYEAMQTVDWTGFPSSGSNTGYYKRGIQKVMGSVASILGEISHVPTQKDEYFQRARKALTLCTAVIDGDPASAIDHNNLGDLYRQIGDYTGDPHQYLLAHQELDLAIGGAVKQGPFFYNTRAFIYWRQGQPLKGLLALQEYDEDKARAAELQDAAQYVDNQVFAARLATSVMSQNDMAGLALAGSVLENARRFVNERQAAFGTLAEALQIKIDDPLAFVYLQMPGYESRTVDAYDRLLALRDVGAAPEALWRRRVRRAKALIRLARLERQRFSSEAAAALLERAHTELGDAGNQVEPFSLDPARVRDLQRGRHYRLRLDTVLALQALVEETIQQGRLAAAREPLDQNSKLLVSLRAALDTDDALRQALGEDVAGVRQQLRRCEAERCFLLGRLAIQLDPDFKDAGLIAGVEANLNAARGVDDELSCRVDLQMGEFLLSAALAGKGDAMALSDRALTSLELATTRDAPRLRAVAIRALAEAIARRTVLRRRAREAAKSAKTK